MAKMIEEVVGEGSKRVRFVRNTPYNGVDYGPDYPESVAVVENRQAHIWIQRGRCVEVAEEVPVANEEEITEETETAEQVEETEVQEVAEEVSIEVPEEAVAKTPKLRRKK